MGDPVHSNVSKHSGQLFPAQMDIPGETDRPCRTTAHKGRILYISHNIHCIGICQLFLFNIYGTLRGKNVTDIKKLTIKRDAIFGIASRFSLCLIYKNSEIIIICVHTNGQQTHYFIIIFLTDTPLSVVTLTI